MEPLQKTLDSCDKNQNQVLPVLEKWVRQNSYSADIDSVNRCGDLIAEDFNLKGLSLEKHPGDGVGDHLVFSTDAWKTSAPGERLVLVGHHDTVFPPGTFDVWEQKGDILRGPGVLDMKGGIVSIWSAFKALSSVGGLSDIPLAFVCVGDEEIGSPHSHTLLKEIGEGCKAGLVFEAGRKEDAIITRRKGTGGIKVTCHGVAAHAGNHHKEGKNAIWELSKFIDKVQKLTDYEKGVTCNVGLVRGGEARNTVPPMAECSIDVRFITRKDGDAVVEQIQQLVKDMSKKGFRFELDGGVKRMPLEKTAQSEKLYKAYAAAATLEKLGGIEAGLIGGGSDASTVSSLGVPSIDGLGPRGSGFHTKKEIIEVSSLVMRSRALIRFLMVEHKALLANDS